MTHPGRKRERAIAEVKRLAPKIGVLKAFKKVADREDTSHRTIQRWWYTHQRQLRQEAVTKEKAQEERPSPPYGRELESDAAGRGDVPPSVGDVPTMPEPPPPKPPRLLINGTLKCSRCSGGHIEKRDDDTFYCQICQVVLQFEGFYEEKTRPYFTSGRFEWML